MRRTLITAVSILAVATPVLASAEDDLTSLSYISYLERYATVQPAGQEENLEAVINMPVISGDRIDSARAARVELVLADGSVLWLDEYSAVSFDALAYSRDTRSDRTVLFLAEGTIILEIPESALASEPTRVDGASATVYLNKPGLFRVEALRDGGLRVEVWQGLAEAASAAGGVLVRTENVTEVSAGEILPVDAQLTWNDDFAMWVEQRRQTATGESGEHVEARYERQAAQLDNYGTWVYVESNDSWAWQPAVADDWRPYSAGRWYWTPTGWAWISYEPWGWLPYHYGNWWHDPHFGWVWSWQHYWSPAWVYWMYWPGYVGWCPAGYYDYWWYDHYGYWHGWHDHWWWYDHPHDPRPPQPPREDVMPRPPREVVSALDERPMDPGRIALNPRGVADVGRIDGRGWNVVSIDDFATSRLSRTVEPGEAVLARSPGATAVVTSGPLVTSRVRVDQAVSELERTFRDARGASAIDLSPVLSRNSAELKPEQALRLVEPRETASLSRVTPSRSASDVGPTIPRLGSTTSISATRRMTPNLHRPTLSGESSGTRTPVRSTSPTFNRVAPTDIRGEGPSPSPRFELSPSSRRSNLIERGSSTHSGSSVRDATGSRPVIIPRPSPSRFDRQPSGSSSQSSSPRISPSGGSPTHSRVVPDSGSSSRSSGSYHSPTSSSSAKPSASVGSSSSSHSSSSARSSSSSHSSSSSSKSGGKR